MWFSVTVRTVKGDLQDGIAMIRDEFWNRMKNVQRIHRFLYAIGLGAIVGKFILLLTTTGGRAVRSGSRRCSMSRSKGNYFLGSAAGRRRTGTATSQADARVEVRVKGTAISWLLQKPVTDPVRIADFLETPPPAASRHAGLC